MGTRFNRIFVRKITRMPKWGIPSPPQFKALDLAGGGFGEIVDEVEPARIFVAREAGLRVFRIGTLQVLKPHPLLEHSPFSLTRFLDSFESADVIQDTGWEGGQPVCRNLIHRICGIA